MSNINTYKYGNVEIVVHRPCLDDKERKKREDALRRAIEAYGKAVMRQKVVSKNGKVAVH